MQGGLCNTQSHILQGSDSGAHAHTLCTTARDKGVEEENALATTWTETSWLRVLPVAQKPKTCWPRSYPLHRNHLTIGLLNNSTKGFTRCTTTIWPKVFKTSWPFHSNLKPHVLAAVLIPKTSWLTKQDLLTNPRSYLLHWNLKTHG